MVLDYAWLIPALPLIAFLAIWLAGQWTPERGGYLAFIAIAASGILSVMVAWAVWQDPIPLFDVGEAFIWTLEENVGQAWLEAGDYVFDLGIYVDSLTAWLLFAVGILTTGIALYSLGYMRPEKDGYHTDDGRHIHIDGRQRYYAALALFVAGMLGFVVGSSLVQLFIFWELMGLCSYLLIGYWYAKPSAAAAAQKAFLVTRVGDVFFLAGLIILAVKFGDVTGSPLALELDTLLNEENIAAVASQHSGALNLAMGCLFIGAVGKSAQLPLHIWLPDAMEGPTTVSALIHAATMVKAGVYLVARFFPLFIEAQTVLIGVGVIGAVTALVAATMAVASYDIKRVLAFSTISQLGYMFLALGAGVVLASEGLSHGLLHLMNHAFFKALLFLCAGAVGFALHNYDMRDFGGLGKYMPITAGTMLLATLSITGVPPFSGFWSKDEVLASTWKAGSEHTIFLALWAIGLITAVLTAYYMFRLWFMTFLGDYRGDEDEDHLHDGTWHMNIVLIVLAGMSLVTGFFIFAGTLPVEVPFWYPGHGEQFHFSISKLANWRTGASLAAVALGAGVAWTKWGPANVEASIQSDEQITGFEKVLYNRYYLTEAYYWTVDKTVVASAFLLDAFDRYVIDWFVDVVGHTNAWFGKAGSRLQTGRVSDYAVAILGGLLAMVVAVVYVLRYTIAGGI